MDMSSLPQRIIEIERFGVGEFSAAEITEKCAFVRALMDARPRPENPHISVIVPAYKEERYILATLRSLAELSYAGCEFLIVSNGEPAGNPTQRIAEACGFTVLHDSVGGIARARQTGLEAAHGEIIVMTDADTLQPAGWLEGIIGILRDPRVRCGSGFAYALSRSAVVRGITALMTSSMRLQHAIDPRLLKGIFEANMFFYRADALAAGGFDASLRMGEGITLFKKLRRPRAPFFFVDRSIAVYTSSRRPERQGPVRWFALMVYNGFAQTLGSKGLGPENYPDVR